MINDLPTPGGQAPTQRQLCEASARRLAPQAPLRGGGATGAFAITTPASASSASADKERNNDMSLTYSEWKNPGIPMSQPLADCQLYLGLLNDLNLGGAEASLRGGGASATSASADKEKNNDMSLTYSEWKNPGILMSQPPSGQPSLMINDRPGANSAMHFLVRLAK